MLSISDLAENKLILLYIAEKIKLPISNIALTEIVLSNNLLNYFTLQQYIFELVSSNLLRNIEKDEKNMLELSDKGSRVLSMFNNRLSKEKREIIDKYLEKNMDNIKKEITITADYTIDENNNFIVELGASENDSPLINLKLTVGSNAQAKSLCSKWKENSSELYNKIISTFIEE
jgi:predicted transcriptional regulator